MKNGIDRDNKESIASDNNYQTDKKSGRDFSWELSMTELSTYYQI
jgi:hypothetical protein